jgi:hypothetical protein
MLVWVLLAGNHGHLWPRAVGAACPPVSAVPCQLLNDCEHDLQTAAPACLWGRTQARAREVSGQSEWHGIQSRMSHRKSNLKTKQNEPQAYLQQLLPGWDGLIHLGPPVVQGPQLQGHAARRRANVMRPEHRCPCTSARGTARRPRGRHAGTHTCRWSLVQGAISVTIVILGVHEENGGLSW